jgi:diacylglycerol kinase family enzyme
VSRVIQTQAAAGLSPIGRRLWAAISLGLGLLTVGVTVVVAIDHFPKGLAILGCLVSSVAGAWYAIRRRGGARYGGLVLAAVLLAGALTLMVAWGYVLDNVLWIVVATATMGAARRAFTPRTQWPAAPRPRHPVLFYNPRSGDGKAERFQLAEEARRRGIEAFELRAGQDLEELARNALEHGADALGMAGGDGSQAIVAMVAAEANVPYACIPAGTRNHFALDLGVDRDDVVGALDALTTGGERRVDLADVNGRVFVNNVSLGLYANAVARPEYRDAKLHTLLDAVPDVLGPRTRAPTLRWQDAGAEESGAAILVSNNPYRLGTALGSGTRPRLDQAVLGVAVLAPVDPDVGERQPRLTMRQWTAPTFEIDSDAPVMAGIDGETAVLMPPLHFQVRPGALRARIASHHPGVSPSALEPSQPWGMVRTLVQYALHGTDAGHGVSSTDGVSEPNMAAPAGGATDD